MNKNLHKSSRHQEKTEKKFFGIRFATISKPCLFDPGHLNVKTGDWVVAETLRGVELGTATPPPEPRPEDKDPLRIFPILRLADDADFAASSRHKLQAAEALEIVRERVIFHNLGMKILDCFMTLDGGRIIIEFAAETRVDFRELVKDLASRLKKRIELHQIGTRDRAILTKGLGICGHELCCHCWMKDFTSVSIRMAKIQGIALNPSKISGPCGKLMCCLKSEYNTYCEFHSKMPEIGDMLIYMGAPVRVENVSLTKNCITVISAARGRFDIPAEIASKLEKTAAPPPEENARDALYRQWHEVAFGKKTPSEELKENNDILEP